VLKDPVRLLETRFTNAISYFKPGPKEPYMDIFMKHRVVTQPKMYIVQLEWIGEKNVMYCIEKVLFQSM
jgi:hypothetical protein